MIKNLAGILKKRYRWYHPVCVLAIAPLYVYVIRPVRVLLNEYVMVPLLKMLYGSGAAIQVQPDDVGTGTLLQSADAGLAVVLAVPGGLVFFVFFTLMLLSAAHMRFYLMLLVLHFGAFIVALFSAAIAGHANVMVLHLIPLFQHYMVLAASFGILFFSLGDRQ